MDPTLLWGLVLMGVAFFLLVLDIFVPSAGILSMLALVASLVGVVVLWNFSAMVGAAALLAVLIGGPIMLYIGIEFWGYTPIGRRLLGVPDEAAQAEIDRRLEAERQARQQRLGLIGSRGVALTDLRPVGVIEIDKQRHDAVSDAAFVPRGTPVRVVAVDAIQLHVRMVSETEPATQGSPPIETPPS